MNLFRRVRPALLLALIFGILFSVSSIAQGPAELNASSPDPTATPTASADPAPAAPLPDSASASKAAADDAWRVRISVYGWFPGIHGNVGGADHNVGVHAPFSDLFHYLKGVIPIAVEADKGRWVMPIDFFWVRMGDNKAIPLGGLAVTYADLHVTESIFTPKVGYRLLDGEHLKIDALGGIRYWYVSQTLSLLPYLQNQSRSTGWVDGIGGARFTFPLSEKSAISVSGDAGGGGASLDYQAVGLFTYDFTPKIGLGLGWRYLDVNYNKNFGPLDGRNFLYDVAQTGALAGLYLNLGGKPPVPVAATCSASPTEIWSGEPVTATITPQHFNPKHTLTYAWSSTGAKVSGSGATGTVDSTGLAPGTYSVTGTATDAKDKKNNVANCSASFTVKQPQPPQVSCSANPTTLAINEPSTITMTATDPQGWPLTYTWTNTGGQLSGSGTSVTVTATNADAGNTITVTGTATDARANLTASCNASINVPAIKQCVNVEDWGECTFEKNPKKPWRVDNDCKDVLDKLSLRLQQMPNGKLNVVGYTDEKESVSEQTIGSQRSVNVTYYLTTDGPTEVDAGRVQPRAGAAKGKATHFYFVPEGNLCGGQLEEGTVVDESQVQPQSRNAPAPTKKHKSKAAPAPAQ
jgi:hypothetical protein